MGSFTSLPDPTRRRTHAPIGEGVGVTFYYRYRIGMPSWPGNYWQRDLDDPVEWDTVTVEGIPVMTPRMKALPEPPPPSDDADWEFPW